MFSLLTTEAGRRPQHAGNLGGLGGLLLGLEDDAAADEVVSPCINGVGSGMDRGK